MSSLYSVIFRFQIQISILHLFFLSLSLSLSLSRARALPTSHHIPFFRTIYLSLVAHKSCTGNQKQINIASLLLNCRQSQSLRIPRHFALGLVRNSTPSIKMTLKYCPIIFYSYIIVDIQGFNFIIISLINEKIRG